MGGGSPDETRFGLHDCKGQTTPFEDFLVGLIHLLVTFLQTGLPGIEAVSVLHDEFPAPHQPKSGANLIPKLCLDLVEVEWHLAI